MGHDPITHLVYQSLDRPGAGFQLTVSSGASPFVGHPHVNIFPSWVRLTVVGAAAAVTGKDLGEGEVTHRAPGMAHRRVAPGPFDFLARQCWEIADLIEDCRLALEEVQDDNPSDETGDIDKNEPPQAEGQARINQGDVVYHYERGYGTVTSRDPSLSMVILNVVLADGSECRMAEEHFLNGVNGSWWKAETT